MESPLYNCLGRADDSYRAGFFSGGVDTMTVETRCKAGFLLPVSRPGRHCKGELYGTCLLHCGDLVCSGSC